MKYDYNYKQYETAHHPRKSIGFSLSETPMKLLGHRENFPWAAKYRRLL